MKQVRKYGFLWIAVLMLAQQAKAQSDAWKEARSIFKIYEGATSLSFKANVKMYAASNPQKIIDQLNAEYVLQDHRYYCKLGSIEIIRNEKGSFMIDHDEKVVVAGKPNRSQTNGKQEDAVFDLNNLFARMTQDSIQLSLSGNSTLKQLNVTGFSDERIVEYKIMYEPTTYRVKRLLIEVRPEDERYGKGNLIVDITYQQHNKTLKPDSYFSTDKYIYVSGRQAIMRPAYKSYQLVNQL